MSLPAFKDKEFYRVDVEWTPGLGDVAYFHVDVHGHWIIVNIPLPVAMQVAAHVALGKSVKLSFAGIEEKPDHIVADIHRVLFQ